MVGSEVKTDLNWLFRASDLSLSDVHSVVAVGSVGMPKFTVLINLHMTRTFWDGLQDCHQ